MSRTPFVPRDVVRVWAAFAGLGAGLVHAATVGPRLTESVVAGVILVVLMAAQLGWALLVLSRGAVPLPRLSVAVSLGLVVLWAGTRATGLAPVGLADVVAAGLHLSVAWLVMADLRATADDARAGAGADAVPDGRSAGAGAGRRFALLFAGALLASAVTTPALAASEAGQHAVPHGEHLTGLTGHH